MPAQTTRSSTLAAARRALATTARVALALALTTSAGVALAQPVEFRHSLSRQLNGFPGPWFTLGSVSVEQIDWAGPWAPTAESNWGRLTLDYQGQPGTFYLNVRIGEDWVIRNMGVDSPLGSATRHLVSTHFPISDHHGIPIELVQMDLIATRVPLPVFDPLVVPPTARLGSFFDVFYEVDSTLMHLGSEHGLTGMPCPILFLPPIVLPALPTSSAQLPDQDKIDNLPQKPNECAPGAVSNSLRYLHARGQGNLGTAPISIAGLGGVLGTDADGTPQDWPTRKRNFFNNNPQYRICTDILAGASQAVIDKVVQAIKDGKDVELDLNGHVVFVAGIRVYPDRVELDVYDDNQTDDKKDPKRTVILKSNGAGGWTCDGFGVDGFVIEAPCPCPADWNHDGVVNALDLNFFMMLYQLNAPQADFNGDGQITPADLNAFMTAFNTPC